MFEVSKHPSFPKGEPIPLRESSASVVSVTGRSQRTVYSQRLPNTPPGEGPTMKVFRGAPRNQQEGPTVNLVVSLSDANKRGQASAELTRDDAFKLMREIVKALDIAPHELAEL
jgi:hypothetical protein